MHKLLTILILSFLFNTFVEGQTTKVDSLKRIVAENKRDTNQVKALNQLSLYFGRRDLDKSLEYAKASEVLARAINNKKRTGIALTSAAVAYMDMGKTDSAELSLAQSLSILEKVKNENVDVALASAYSLQGHLQNNRNNADKAFELYLKAAKICETSSDPKAKRVLPVHYNNLANLFKNQEKYDKGLKYGLKALEAAKNSNALTRSVLMSTVGKIYMYLGDEEKALSYYNEALMLKEEIDDKIGMITLLSAIGDVYFDKADYKNAALKFKEVERLTEEANYSQGRFISQFSFAKLFYAQKKYSQSIQHSKKALQLTRRNEVESKVYLEEIYHMLAKSYAAQGQFEAAFNYQVKYSAIQDTISEQNQKEHISELETKYDVEKKELENEYLKAEQAKNKTILQQRSYLMIGAIVTIVLLVILAMQLFRANKTKQNYNQQLETTVAERTAALQKANENLEQANYELRTFNYIASHDIKEPIRNIGSYASLIFRKLPDDLKTGLGDYFQTIKRSTTQLYTLVEDFAKYTTLSKNDAIEKHEVDLNNLVNSVEDNLSETISKYNGSVVYHDLPTIISSSSLLYTALKNLIENGLKYNQSDKPTVEISFVEKTETYEIIVSDNGIGIDEEYYDKIFEMFKRLHHRGEYEGSGIGLAIVKLAIGKLGGTVHVNSDKKGSRFILELPK